MSKSVPARSEVAVSRQREDSKASADKDVERPRETWRDSVESVVVAFMLALLLRGFDAEAFVIPTGSMAPTLMGRHKEIDCPQCGTAYSVNANEEVRNRGARVVAGTCPNCRYRARVDESPSFNGDRILVMKFPYDLPWLPFAGKPERWDVVVFHYPERPNQNYIKRLVGLPDEELLICGGDVWAKSNRPGADFEIQRKPARKLRSMLIPVYDDRRRPAAFSSLPDWKRWKGSKGGQWQEIDVGSSTYAAEVGKDISWLEYRHLTPDLWQWEAVLTGGPVQPPRPSLIDDFYSYNSDQLNPNALSISEPHWVGDLFVEFDLEAESTEGELLIELVEGGYLHRCVIDLATGTATVARTREGSDGGTGSKAAESALTPIRGPGRHQIGFANIDDRMTLWVDGDPIFGEGVAYERKPEDLLTPTEEDLVPVRIGLRGGKARVSGLVLKRDIYYVLEPGESDYRAFSSLTSEEFLELSALLRDPSRFSELASQDRPKTYSIREGHYMMLGDNSPRSHDSRKWSSIDTTGGSYFDDSGRLWHTDAWDNSDRRSFEVPEELIIGKAFFIYWPHGKPFGPDIRVNPDFRVPFRPYVERMKWIR